MRYIFILLIFFILSCEKEPIVTYDGRWNGWWYLDVTNVTKDTIKLARKFRVVNDSLEIRLFDSPLTECKVTTFNSNGYRCELKLCDTAMCQGVTQITNVTYNITGSKNGSFINEIGDVIWRTEWYRDGALIAKKVSEGICNGQFSKYDDWVSWN